MPTIKCPVCDTEEQTAEAVDSLKDVGLFRCDVCKARVVYGTVIPRLVVEPYTDERGHKWVRQRWQDPKSKRDIFVADIDPLLVVSVVKNLLSLVVP